jgi:predicted transglutaminase-like cysteine proteinase
MNFKEVICKILDLVPNEEYIKLNEERVILKKEIDGLTETLTKKEENYHITGEKLTLLQADYTRLQDKLQITEETLTKALNKGKLDIISLQDYYEGKRRLNTWEYDGTRLGKTDVKDYLQRSDAAPFKIWAKQYINSMSLKKSMSISNIITKIYNTFAYEQWTYTSDKEQFGKMEYWENPTQVFKTKTSDCESRAMSMYWCFIEVLKELGLEQHEWRLTFVASIVLGEGGHAYLTWLHDDGEYYVIESTYDILGSFTKTWLKTPLRFNNMYTKFYGFATYYKSWSGGNTSMFEPKEI